MKIKLKDAYKILQEASAVIIDNSVVGYPALAELEGSVENQFMYLTWDDDGCSLKFCEGDNQEVEVIGNSMFLYDTDANDDFDHTQITILVPQNLEVDNFK